jgi:hypothetical protein
MRTGNIVKTAYGDIVIISQVKDNYINWISASHGNCQGGTQKLTTETEVDCDCVSDCCGQPDIDCPDCKGTGKITKVTYGMDKAIVLADNMFEYIKSRMLKNFDF